MIYASREKENERKGDRETERQSKREKERERGIYRVREKTDRGRGKVALSFGEFFN